MVQSHKRHKSHRAVTDTHTHTHCHRKTRTGTGHSPTPRNKKTLILQKQFYKEQLLERTTKTCSLKQRVENMFRTHARTNIAKKILAGRGKTRFDHKKLVLVDKTAYIIKAEH